MQQFAKKIREEVYVHAGHKSGSISEVAPLDLRGFKKLEKRKQYRLVERNTVG